MNRFTHPSVTASSQVVRTVVVRAVLLAVTAILLLGACSPSDPEPTTAELLEGLEGRELTPAEVAEREEVAQLLCGLNDEVLVRIWEQLDDDQLAFQDFVFGRQCPARNGLYAEATGRFSVSDGTEGAN